MLYMTVNGSRTQYSSCLIKDADNESSGWKNPVSCVVRDVHQTISTKINTSTIGFIDILVDSKTTETERRFGESRSIKIDFYLFWNFDTKLISK